MKFEIECNGKRVGIKPDYRTVGVVGPVAWLVVDGSSSGCAVVVDHCDNVADVNSLRYYYPDNAMFSNPTISGVAVSLVEFWGFVSAACKEAAKLECDKEGNLPVYHTSRCDDDLIRSARRNQRAYRRNRRTF